MRFQQTIEDQIGAMVGIDKWFNTYIANSL
jgi:hypothetical protein